MQIKYDTLVVGSAWKPQITANLRRSNHTSSVSLHYLVKCRCLTSNNWNETTSVATHTKHINKPQIIGIQT